MELQIEYLAPETLKPYARNARVHTTAQIDALVESIRRFGFVAPVLISDDDKVIAGHARLAAAQRLKLDKIPCVRLSHLSSEQRRAYVLADNRLAEMASWDEELLRVELASLSTQFDLSFLDFDFVLPEQTDISSVREKQQSVSKNLSVFEVSVVCRDEYEQKSVYDHLTTLGYKCRVLSV